MTGPFHMMYAPLGSYVKYDTNSQFLVPEKSETEKLAARLDSYDRALSQMKSSMLTMVELMQELRKEIDVLKIKQSKAVFMSDPEDIGGERKIGL